MKDVNGFIVNLVFEACLPVGPGWLVLPGIMGGSGKSLEGFGRPLNGSGRHLEGPGRLHAPRRSVRDSGKALAACGKLGDVREGSGSLWELGDRDWRYMPFRTKPARRYALYIALAHGHAL